MAPEVLSEKAYNEKADLWSCGVIMYLLLVGYPPFTGETRKDIMTGIIRGTPSYSDPAWTKISTDGQDLVRKMLCYDSDLRISASEALKHPWITKCSEKATVTMTDARLSLMKMERFQTQSLLQRAVFTFMATHQITSLEEAKLKEIFNLFDIDKDGQISKEELIKGYIMLYGDSKRAKKAADRIFENVDVNGNQMIDYNGTMGCFPNIPQLEFLAGNFEIKKAMTEENLKEAFAFYDKVKQILSLIYPAVKLK